MRWVGLVFGIPALVVAGCGDDGPAVTPDAAAADAGAGDAAPAATPPVLVVLTCPPGWMEQTPHPGMRTCVPWASDGVLDCGVDEAQFPGGGGGCVLVGAECPAGDFATPPDGASALLYVRAGASGGDGSEAAPYGRIADATARARSGTVVMVGKGRYAEEVRVASGVTIHGACVGETVLTYAVASTSAGVVIPSGTGGVVSNLRIADAMRPATFVSGGADVLLRDVVVDNVEFGGLIAYGGGRILGERIVVRNTRSRTLNRAGGAGLVVLESTAEIRGAVFERNRDLGMTADGAGASLVLEDAVIRDTAGRDTDRANGRGLEVSDGAHAELRRVLIERNPEVGVWLHLGDALIVAEMLVVRDTRVRESDGAEGMGIAIADRARFEGAGVLVSGNLGQGMIVEDGSVSVQDLIVSDTESNPEDGYFGRGFGAQLTATVELTRAAFLRNRDVSLFAGGDAVSVTISDMLVSTTRGEAAGGFHGRAIEVQDYAVVQVERGHFEDNREVALSATTQGAVLRGTDIVVRQTVPRDCMATTDCWPAGIGVGAFNSGAVELSRFLVTGANLCGLQLAANGMIDLSDGAVTDNPFGACIQVSGYDVMRLSRNVRYRNDTDLGTTTLPVPDASTGALLGP